MAVTRASDLIIPEVFAETIQGELAGMTALFGTPAAIVRTGLPGDLRGGHTVNIPYFGTLADLEDAPADENASTDANNLSVPTIQKITMTQEQATVSHSRTAFEASRFSQFTSLPDGDPITEASRQMRILVQRRADKALIAEAETTDLERDIYNDSTPASLDWTEVEEAKGLFGDEMTDIAALAVHSKVYTRLKTQVDANGRPLVYMPERQGELATIGGVPIVVSDRLTVTPEAGGTGTADSYTSLLLKRNSLIFWMNGTPSVRTDTDILSDSDILAVHVYWAAHRYKNLPGSSKAGVAKIIHNL
jgi:hypothetical protein